MSMRSNDGWNNDKAQKSHNDDSDDQTPRESLGKAENVKSNVNSLKTMKLDVETIPPLSLNESFEVFFCLRWGPEESSRWVSQEKTVFYPIQTQCSWTGSTVCPLKQQNPPSKLEKVPLHEREYEREAREESLEDVDVPFDQVLDNSEEFHRRLTSKLSIDNYFINSSCLSPSAWLSTNSSSLSQRNPELDIFPR